MFYDTQNMTEKRGRKGRIITCPYCRKRFSLHSKKKTPHEKALARNYARRKRASKKFAESIAKSIFRQ